MKNININNSNEEELAQGKYSTIHSYIDISNEKQWIIKKIKAGSTAHFLKIMQSVVHGFNLDHPSIISVKNYLVETLEHSNYNVYVQMLRMEENLDHFMTRKQQAHELGITREHIIEIFDEIIIALEYLQKKDLAHGNLKPNNIFVDSEGKIRLADIGSSIFVPEQETLESISEDLYYQAPEKIETMQNNIEIDLYKADIWSLGIVIAELVLGRQSLIDPLLSFEEKEEAVKQVIEEMKEKESDILANLVERMLAIQSDERPELSQIKKELEENFKGIVPGEAVKDKEKEEEKEKEKEKNGLMIPIDKNYFSPGKVPKGDEKADPFEVANQKRSDTVLMQNWDLFANSLQVAWEREFKLQLNDPLVIKASGIGVNDDQICKFLMDLSAKISNHQITGIRVLDFNLPAESMTDEGVKLLGVNIGESYYLKDLQVLNLNLAKTPFIKHFKITNDGIKELVMNIGKNLRGLRSLGLSFSEYYSLTDSGFESIGVNIGHNLINLRELKLDFSWCSEVNDKAIKLFASNLKPCLKNLQHLNLDFRRCWKISDDGMKYLAESICTNGIHLQQLELYFYACTQISDKGVKYLGDGVSNLKELRQFILNLYTCDKVSELVKDFLRQKLSFVMRLEIV